jgi:hypothetical protein
MFGTAAALVAFVAAPGTAGVQLGLGGGLDWCEGVGVGRGDAPDGPGLADGIDVGRGTFEVGVAVADGDAEPKPGGGWMLTLRPK